MRVAELLRLDREACSALSTRSCSRAPRLLEQRRAHVPAVRTDEIALKTAVKTVSWNRPSETLRYAARHVAGDTRLARARNLLRVTAQLAAESKAIFERAAIAARGSVVAMLGCPPAASDAVRALDEHWDGKGQAGRPRGRRDPAAGRASRAWRRPRRSSSRTYGLEAAREMVARGGAGAGSTPRSPTPSSRSASARSALGAHPCGGGRRRVARVRAQRPDARGRRGPGSTAWPRRSPR